MDIGTELTSRLGSAAPGLTAGALATAALAALAVVLVPTIWLQLRIAVTLVHELGHAIIGIAFGRRFTGFVVRGDMSGHAVTVGPARGIGRIATTWAGYPMPALVGLLMVWSATTGYAAALLFACLLTLVVVLVFVRSAGTLATVAAAGRRHRRTLVVAQRRDPGSRRGDDRTRPAHRRVATPRRAHVGPRTSRPRK